MTTMIPTTPLSQINARFYKMEEISEKKLFLKYVVDL